MKNLKTLIATIILSILFISSLLADHLKGKSKQELDRFLKGRVVGTPAEFNKILITAIVSLYLYGFVLVVIELWGML